ncbi:MAG: glycosyltransferase, partial [Actinomycetota bacterium]|nr:glycosyltransferase [Actinomycetota bacterium]
MAAGVPVVATDIEGYRQVVTAEIDAVVVPPGDGVALARALGRVLDDHDLARRLAQAGRRTAASFDWAVVADRLEGLYRSVLSRPSLR